MAPKGVHVVGEKHRTTAWVLYSEIHVFTRTPTMAKPLNNEEEAEATIMDKSSCQHLILAHYIMLQTQPCGNHHHLNPQNKPY